MLRQGVAFASQSARKMSKWHLQVVEVEVISNWCNF